MEARELRDAINKECESKDECTKCRFDGARLCSFGDATDELLAAAESIAEKIKEEL
jgi:hypothetical protein